MSGFNPFKSIGASLRQKKLKQRLQAAQSWPLVTGAVLSWKVVQAEEEISSFAASEQLEAEFYFTVKGEYFGGHFRSVPLSKTELRAMGEATPPVNVRYDPENPDANIVLPEDNVENLPFKVLPSSGI